MPAMTRVSVASHELGDCVTSRISLTANAMDLAQEHGEISPHSTTVSRDKQARFKQLARAFWQVRVQHRRVWRARGHR